MSQEFIVPADTQRREFMIARISRFLAEVFPGKRVQVTVDRHARERTNPQCRWLNGVAYKLLSEATGYDRDDISEYMCGTYFGWKAVKCPKTPRNHEGLKDVPIRTTTRDADGKRSVLTTLEFADYKDFIQRFGAKRGIDIPDPNEEAEQQQEAA